MHAATATARSNRCARDATVLPGTVGHLAAEVASRLVSRDGAPLRPLLREVFVQRLCDAALSPDPLALKRMKSDLRRARISAANLADGYIPEVARRVGRDWETDALSFACVTMAVARLQAMLRELGVGWSADQAAAAAHRRARGVGRSILMILPEGEQHSLGALVITGQLRRLGVSVCLRIAPTDADLRRLLGERRFDAAMLSIAGEARLAPAARALRLLADLTGGRMRAAVGGWLATQAPDLARLVGAVVATNDVSVALRALGCDADPADAASPSPATAFPCSAPDHRATASTG